MVNEVHSLYNNFLYKHSYLYTIVLNINAYVIVFLCMNAIFSIIVYFVYSKLAFFQYIEKYINKSEPSGLKTEYNISYIPGKIFFGNPI